MSRRSGLSIGHPLRDRMVDVLRGCTARAALSKLVVRDTELGDRARLVGAGLLALQG